MSSADWCSQNNSSLLSSQCVCGPDFSLSPTKSCPLCTIVDIFLSLAAFNNLIGCYCRGPLSLYTMSEDVGKLIGEEFGFSREPKGQLFSAVCEGGGRISPISVELATNKHSHQAHSQQPQTDNCFFKKKKRRENVTKDSWSSPNVKDTKRIKKCYLQFSVFFFLAGASLSEWRFPFAFLKSKEVVFVF